MFRATKPRYALVHSTRLQTASIPSSSSPLCHLLLTSTHWHRVERGKGHWTQLPFLWVCSFPEWNPMERLPGSQASFEVTAWIRSNARERGKFSPRPKVSPSALCILLDCRCSDSVPFLLLQPPQHLHPFQVWGSCIMVQPCCCLCTECFLKHLCARVCSFTWLAKCHLLCHATLEPCLNNSSLTPALSRPSRHHHLHSLSLLT